MYSARLELVELCGGGGRWKWARCLKTVPLKLLVAENEILLKAGTSTEWFIVNCCLYFFLRDSRLRSFQHPNRMI